MSEALSSQRCKVDGCTGVAISRMGRYAGLCIEHQAVEDAQRQFRSACSALQAALDGVA